MALDNLFGPETVAAMRTLIGSGALAAAASSMLLLAAAASAPASSAGGASAAPSSDGNSSAAESGATAAATTVQADDTGATASAGAAAATGGCDYYAPGHTDKAGVFEDTAEGTDLMPFALACRLSTRVQSPTAARPQPILFMRLWSGA